MGRTTIGQWWLGRNTGDGAFQNRYFGAWDSTIGWRDVVFGDFAGDGKLDVLGRSAIRQWWLGANTGSGFANQNVGSWSPNVGWRDVQTLRDPQAATKQSFKGRGATAADLAFAAEVVREESAANKTATDAALANHEEWFEL